MNARPLALAAVLLWPIAALAQGFAGLGEMAEGFALPAPETRFTFPEDHGAHPDFRIEWWYATANLTDADGTQYGIQWTLFRNALRPPERPEDQAWMGHAGVSSPQGHLYAERLARGGLGHAGVTAQPFEAFIDEWRMTGPSLAEVRITAQGSDFAYDLDFTADRPFVLQGLQGFSVKSTAGQASHYYSQPFYRVTGTLTLPTGPVEVSGQGWLDREWSSQPLAADQTGWDWISLHLDTGEKLMGYRLRDETGGDYVTGTWIAPDGTPTPLSPDQIAMTPLERNVVSGREIPTAWQVDIPDQGAKITVRAIYPQSWMGTRIPYWEGPVTVKGSHNGIGYLEMSGYE